MNLRRHVILAAVCVAAGVLLSGGPEANYPGVNEGTLTLTEEEAVIEYTDDDGARWLLRYDRSDGF